MKIFTDTPNDSSPVQNIYLNQDDIGQISNIVTDSGNFITHQILITIKKFHNNNDDGVNDDIMDLVAGNTEVEKEILEFLSYYKLLDNINNKLKKEIENVLKPVLQNCNELSIDIGEEETFYIGLIKQDKNKFSYTQTKEALLKSPKLDLNTDEGQQGYMSTLVDVVGFKIGKTALEQTLKDKDFLEDQIIDVVENYITTKVNKTTKIEYGNVGDLNIGLRNNLIFLDFIKQNGSVDIKEMMRISKQIELILKDYSYINRKLKEKIQYEKYICKYFRAEEISKVTYKFDSLFIEKDGQIIDLVELIAESFHLNNDDINNFVNSRKTNEMILPFTSISVPYYTHFEEKIIYT